MVICSVSQDGAACVWCWESLNAPLRRRCCHKGRLSGPRLYSVSQHRLSRTSGTVTEHSSGEITLASQCAAGPRETWMFVLRTWLCRGVREIKSRR